MTQSGWRTPTTILVCGGIILTVALGVRHNFGLYLQPMTTDLGIGREVFSIAIALQNLVYGLAQPFTGMIADKLGAAHVLIGGAIVYALGLAFMSVSSTSWELEFPILRCEARERACGDQAMNGAHAVGDMHGIGPVEAKANVATVLTVDGIEALLHKRIWARVDADVAPKFKVGDEVIARNIHPEGHTRLPRYARGRRSVIDRVCGVYVFPDTSAMTRDPKPQHMYSVRFASRELWGPQALRTRQRLHEPAE